MNGRTVMKPSAMAATLGLACLALSWSVAPAYAVTKRLDLPPDGLVLKGSDLPGYALAQRQCVGCHSAEYMVYQPPNAARPYWDAMVKRMKVVFKAPLNDADMPLLVDYLVKTYGAEQPR